MTFYTAYEFLSFILPGGAILFTTAVGLLGWDYREPGASTLTAIFAAAFVVGHLNAALAAFLEPVLWGRAPGTEVDPHGPVFGKDALRRLYPKDTGAIRARFEAMFGKDLSDRLLYHAGHTLLQQRRKDAAVQIMNQQLAFYRSMAMASAVCLAVTLVHQASGRSHLPAAVWAPLFGVAAALFGARYRRYWNLFAEHVVRGILALDVGRPPEQRDAARAPVEREQPGG